MTFIRKAIAAAVLVGIASTGLMTMAIFLHMPGWFLTIAGAILGWIASVIRRDLVKTE